MEKAAWSYWFRIKSCRSRRGDGTPVSGARQRIGNVLPRNGWPGLRGRTVLQNSHTVGGDST